jgi:hypothetical protein
VPICYFISDVSAILLIVFLFCVPEAPNLKYIKKHVDESKK